jgi:membrane-associated phospholipid phosphatase
MVMDFGFQSNFRNVLDIFFKQITELGSLTIVLIAILFTYFFDSILAVQLFIGVASVTLISFLIKALFFHARPKKQAMNTLVERLDASSFPSIHSARITVLVFWLIIISTDVVLKIILAIIGLTVAYSRIYLQKHYFVDVIGGIILAMIANLLIYFI